MARVDPQAVVTHPNKILFPQVGFTKQDAIDYYRAVAPYILPHLKNRPLTLKLFPHGLKRPAVWLKDAPPFTPTWVRTASIERKDKSHGRPQIAFVLVNDLRTLLWTVNLSSIELHIFLAKAVRIDRPSFVVFDLDPGEPATIVQCSEVALKLRDELKRLRLKSFVKASGSKGLQLYAPLNTPVTYDQTGAFARDLAERLERQHPDLVVSEMPKSLRHGKVFIDWSQNAYYKSTVCVYSLRANSEVPWASMPLSWQEVRRAWNTQDGTKLYFSPESALKRLKRRGDLFKDVLTLKQKLPRTRLPSAATPLAPSASSNATNGEASPAAVRQAIGRLPKAAAGFVEPMQPQIVDRLPEGDQWQYEVKWDGYRAIGVKRGTGVALYSRRQRRLGERYPAVLRALRQLHAATAVVDGEIVALDDRGRPSFQLLQNALSAEQTPIVFVAFDLLNLEGKSLLRLPLVERQKLLNRVAAGTTIQLSTPLDATLERIVDVVQRFGLEGIVAKKRNSRYQPGSRGRGWFKYRVRRGQEFVIGGFTSDSPLAGLLVGYYEGRKLLYAAKVKAGFTPAVRRALFARLEPLISQHCPFANLPEGSAGRWGEGLTAEKMLECTWTRPKLVAQVDFVQWTRHHHLRHAKFLGLRDDKRPRDVVREIASPGHD